MALVGAQFKQDDLAIGRVMLHAGRVAIETERTDLKRSLESGVIGRNKQRYTPADGVDFVRAVVFQFSGSRVRALPIHDEPRTAARKRPAEGQLHKVADRLQPKLSVALRHAFAQGRKVLKPNPLKNIDKAVEAVAGALKKTLPAALRETYVAGGEAGAAIVAPRLKIPDVRITKVLTPDGWKTLGDVEGHPFHGNQWTGGFGMPNEDSGKHYYHATSTKNLSAIAAKGLVPGVETENVSLATDLESLKWWASNLDKDATAVLRVSKSSIKTEQLYQDVVGATRVPASKLEVFHKGSWKSLHQLRGASLRTAKRTSTTPIAFTFDAKQQSAVDWADRHAAELIDGISETTKQDINNAIAAALDGEGIDSAIEEIMAAVGDQDRAEMIAHHEVMTAVHEGQREAWSQAVDAGLLTGLEKRVWIVTGDGKVCPICEGLEDKRAKLGEPYESDGEEFDGPPAHVRCRCTEGIAG